MHAGSMISIHMTSIYCNIIDGYIYRCIALLLSGIKQSPNLPPCSLYPGTLHMSLLPLLIICMLNVIKIGVPTSPHRIKHALHNSCLYIEGVNPLGQVR